MNLPEDALLVADITGGTKIMSAALTLVMMEHRSRFAYVGGASRTKAGLGIVKTGHEIFMQQDNPWDVMALREVRNLARSFNSGEFAAAWEIAKELAANVTTDGKFYTCLNDLVEAYCLWDGFAHKRALNKLNESIGRLEPFALNTPRWRKQLDLFKESKGTLEKVEQDAQELRAAKGRVSPTCGRAYLCDLLANARRRMRAGRYDDAVVRLYSGIEKIAKIALLARHGIDNSNIDLERTPEGQRDSLRAAMGNDGRIRIGLQKSFALLDALEDPLGRQYSRHEKELRRTLDARNQSLLAHGYNPVTASTCKKLFPMALEFLDLNEKDLPEYPPLDWKSLIFDVKFYSHASRDSPAQAAHL
jgi:CRISPR-associated protein (TIGR02710 family)